MDYAIIIEMKPVIAKSHRKMNKLRCIRFSNYNILIYRSIYPTGYV
jgi:hypothetical protein